jgi:hypothetical protein
MLIRGVGNRLGDSPDYCSHSTQHRADRTAGLGACCHVADARITHARTALAAAVTGGPWGTCTDTHTSRLLANCYCATMQHLS